MEAALLGASVVAAFVAGSVALFAPCCITVLLPAYFASAFHQKERMLAMTIVFFAGIAVILVPVGLGAGFLTQIFGQYHNPLYVAGGILMILLGGASLAGKRLVHVKLPFRAPALDVKRPWSVFLLGVFSGAATSCCAPVLAGVMTLAVLSGSFWNAVIVSIAYVFGMTVPLFVSAYFYDRWNLRESLLMRGATVKIPLRGRVYALHSTNLVAATVFFFIISFLPIPVILGTFCAISRHEQDIEHKAVPHSEGLPPRHSKDDAWPLSRILPMRMSRI